MFKVDPNSRFIPPTSTLLPVQKATPSFKKISDPTSSQADRQHSSLVQFWSDFLNLCMKIPLIDLAFSYLWKMSHAFPFFFLKKPSLLETITIEVPSYFTLKMELVCGKEILKDYVARLQEYILTSPCDQNEFKKFSAFPIPKSCGKDVELRKACKDLVQQGKTVDPALEEYIDPFTKLRKGCESALQESITQFIAKTKKNFPKEPIQLHLGEPFYHSLSPEVDILSTSFITAFSSVLEKNETPINYLHVHGSFEKSKDIETLFQGIGKNSSIRFLNLNLRSKDCKKAVEVLEKVILHNHSIENIIIQNQDFRNKTIIEDTIWEGLFMAVLGNGTLKTLRFFHTPPLPLSLKTLADEVGKRIQFV